MFQIAVWLERLYLPAFYYIIKLNHLHHAISSRDSAPRCRAVIGVCGFVVLYLLTGYCSLTVVVAWQLASLVRIHVVRFVDCFQHAYEQIDGEHQGPRKDRLYETHYTFSVPVARKYTFLNVFILNFGYHGAHHSFPTCPWYGLPALDRLIAEHMSAQLATCRPREEAQGFAALVRAYQRNHLSRLISNDEGLPYDSQGNFSVEQFTGAYTDKLAG